MKSQNLVLLASFFAVLFLLFFRSTQEGSSAPSATAPLLRIATIQPEFLASAAARLQRIHADLHSIGEATKNNMGHTGQHPEHVALNAALVARETAALSAAAFAEGRPFTVCEVGFNLGHSAATFAASVGNGGDSGVGRYLAFDKLEAPGVETSLNYLRAEFPAATWELTAGDSKVTLPNFRRAHPNARCDLIHIDGDHGLVMPGVDLNNLRAMANEHALVVFDDCGCAEEEASWWCIGPTRTFTQAVNDGVLEQLSFREIVVAGGKRGTCAGRLQIGYSAKLGNKALAQLS
jgi:hypothetical protein